MYLNVTHMDVAWCPGTYSIEEAPSCSRNTQMVSGSIKKGEAHQTGRDWIESGNVSDWKYAVKSLCLAVRYASLHVSSLCCIQHRSSLMMMSLGT